MLYSTGIVGIFPLIIQRSNLDGGTLNLVEGMLTLDGGTHLPSNLSSGCNIGVARGGPGGPGPPQSKYH